LCGIIERSKNMAEENWYPSKAEYDQKITKEQWLELLKVLEE